MVAPAPKPQPASADREKTEPARAPVEPPKPAPVAPPSPAISTQTNEATRPARIEVATLAGSRWPAQAFPKPTPGKRDEAVAQFQRGAQYQKDGLLDAAIFCYREALKLDPTLTAAYYNLGTALQGQNMLNQAIDSYLHAVSLQPGFTNARLNLAILFEAQGYRADAAEQYQAILREAPNDAKAHLALGRLYAGQPSTQSLSRQHYQRFLDLEPTSPEAKRVQQWLQENK
jgi:tetratricopeptide (TPR) repeat protein